MGHSEKTQSGRDTQIRLKKPNAARAIQCRCTVLTVRSDRYYYANREIKGGSRQHFDVNGMQSDGERGKRESGGSRNVQA